MGVEADFKRVFADMLTPARERLRAAWLAACRNEEHGTIHEIRLDRLEGRQLLLALLNFHYAGLLQQDGVDDPELALIMDGALLSLPVFESGQRANARNGILEKLVRLDVSRLGTDRHPTTITYVTLLLMTVNHDEFASSLRSTLRWEPRWWLPIETAIPSGGTDFAKIVKERLNRARRAVIDRRFAMVDSAGRTDCQRELRTLEDEVLHNAAVIAQGNAILKRFDNPDSRKRRMNELAQHPGAMKIRMDGKTVTIPFTLQYEPELQDNDRYRSFELRGRPLTVTFPYLVEPIDRRDGFKLPAESERPDQIDALAAALHAEGAVFANGTKLAAIRRVKRDDDGRLRFEFHGVRYYDYFAANVINDTDYNGLERPEHVWNKPRGAFPGASALVITKDRYVVLPVRGKRVAADRNTINASVSGGIELDDIEPAGSTLVSAPFEEALLREGESEISKVFSTAARHNSALTFLGFLRNLHRNFLAELLWLVELHDLTADEWINRWRTERVRLDEGYELADESGMAPQRWPRGRGVQLEWLPSILFVQHDLVVRHAADVLDPLRLKFEWLLRAKDERVDGRTGVKTTLDRDPSFGDEVRRRAFDVLAHRQPAPPLIAALGAYMHMRTRSRSK